MSGPPRCTGALPHPGGTAGGRAAEALRGAGRRRAEIARLGDASEALRQWPRAMEEYFSAFSGLPEPLMAAARAREPDNPLTLPCDDLIATTDECLRAAQRAGHARQSVKGYDLLLAAVSVAWISGTGATDEEPLGRLHALIESGYREQDDEE
ncbi:hypothetical protein GCM10010256_74160 [Streptomyces coeruleorubidus]|nr:hypothetical protein GCM10010256_74160 [Streptomyces coeruleorubidus]